MKRSIIVGLALATLSIVGSLPACSSAPFGGSCTLIGCADSLAVQLVDMSGLADGDYVLTVTDTSNSAARTCDVEVRNGSIFGVNNGCTLGFQSTSDTVSFFDFVPADATLAFADAMSTIAETTVAITYVESNPNGPDCGPTCFQSDAVAFDLVP